MKPKKIKELPTKELPYDCGIIVETISRDNVRKTFTVLISNYNEWGSYSNRHQKLEHINTMLIDIIKREHSLLSYRSFAVEFVPDSNKEIRINVIIDWKIHQVEIVNK